MNKKVAAKARRLAIETLKMEQAIGEAHERQRKFALEFHRKHLPKDFLHSQCCSIGGIMTGNDIAGWSGTSPCPCGVDELVDAMRVNLREKGSAA